MTDDELRELLRTTATATAERVDKKMDATVAEMRRHVEESAAETRRHVDQTAVETRRHFEVIAEHLETRIDAVAESVQILDEKLDRETANIRDEMARGFAETQAMIKFSHADLDRRMRTLEETVADLQTRVERLELSTH
jgi:DNA-binding ferritin-like protein